jgi:2',3'-cyclic-nucleotide 2'-phosphodiesterase (5'-nucleotidase family)
MGIIWLISGCAKVYYVATEEVSSYSIDKKTIDVSTGPMEDMIAPFREDLTAEMSQVISLAAASLEKGDRGASESTLGNWVADAVLAEAQVISKRPLAFGICNSGGIRVPSLPAGPITRGHIYELMPFDNYLVTMQLPGSVLKMLFDKMAASGGWPISAGISYEIKDGKAQSVRISGQAIADSQTYEFALSDYLAEGGGDLDFLKEYPYENLGVYYRDALIEYALLQGRINKPLEARLEGRVINLDK